jgi:hypothetical protein
LVAEVEAVAPEVVREVAEEVLGWHLEAVAASDGQGILKQEQGQEQVLA